MANKIYYWDSSVFCSFLSKEPDRYEIAYQILDEAEAGNVQIVTSYMTITEALKVAKKKVRDLSEKDKETIRRFFQKEYFNWINFDRHVAETARELCWAHGLKSKDAVHLASVQHAILVEKIPLDAVHAFDGDFTKLEGKVFGINCPIVTPAPDQTVMILGDQRKKTKKKLGKKRKRSN